MYILNVLVSFKQPVGDELSPFHSTQHFFLLPFTINATLSGVWFVRNNHLVDGQTSRSSRYVWATKSLARFLLSPSLFSPSVALALSLTHPTPATGVTKKRIINTKKPPALLVPFTDTAELSLQNCSATTLASPPPTPWAPPLHSLGRQPLSLCVDVVTVVTPQRLWKPQPSSSWPAHRRLPVRYMPDVTRSIGQQRREYAE